MKNIPLYLQIVAGLLLGLITGLLIVFFNIDTSWITDFIKPLGTIFMRLLKMIAVPMVIISLLLGIISLSDINKLSKLGFRTISIYMITTVLAITIGLITVNTINPGKISETSINYSAEPAAIPGNIDLSEDQPILQPLVDMVPENIFQAFSSNSAILQVVFFTLILGVAFIKARSSAPFEPLLQAANNTILKLVDIIMLFAPVGVFALMMSMVVDVSGNDINHAIELLKGLLWYSLTVILGLALMILVVYTLLLKLFTDVPIGKFFRSIRAVQVLAFSTSSSNATLPLTMKRTEEELNVPKEISSFVLPLGATVNMDGTSLYQGVAAVFIAQVMGIELTLADQLMIVFTATLASIGSAGVPGSGLVMMVIILQAVGIPIEGLAIILAVDRILDMFRTVVNVTGDTVVACVMSKWMSKNQLPDQEQFIDIKEKEPVAPLVNQL
ncbi:MAG: dicarboxylate/amino acid:cation symporter [Candidatus Cyclobacteriaceae bacterium M2_1C_046]